MSLLKFENLPGKSFVSSFGRRLQLNSPIAGASLIRINTLLFRGLKSVFFVVPFDELVRERVAGVRSQRFNSKWYSAIIALCMVIGTQYQNVGRNIRPIFSEWLDVMAL